MSNGYSWIALAALVAAASGAADPPFAPPPNLAGQSAWIPLRHQSQELNMCVPTSASIVLDYFGDPIGPREIKTLSRKREYVPGGEFNDFTETFFPDLLAGLARRGYHWREKNYPQTNGGFDRGVTDVERSLDAGIPVIIATTLGIGHVYIVAGYWKAKGLVYVMDPGSEAPGIRAVRFSDLIWIWKDGEAPSDRRWAVFPERRGTRIPASS